MAKSFLHIRSGETSAARVVELVGAIVRVGRGAQCEVCVEDPALESVECVIRKRGDSWLVQPVGRPGKLLLGGKPVHAQTAWPQDVLLQVGEHGIERQVEERVQTGPGSFDSPIELGAAPEPAAADTPAAWRSVALAAAVPPPSPVAGAHLHGDRTTEAEPISREERSAHWRQITERQKRWEARWRAAGAQVRAQAQAEAPPAPPRPESRTYREVEQFRKAWDAPEPQPEPVPEPEPEPQLEPDQVPCAESESAPIELTVLEAPLPQPEAPAETLPAESIAELPPEPAPPVLNREPVVAEIPPAASAEPEAAPRDILRPDESRRPRGRFGGENPSPPAPAARTEPPANGPTRLGSTRTGPASRPVTPPWQNSPAYGGFAGTGAGLGGYAPPGTGAPLGSGAAPAPLGWGQENLGNEWPSARAILEAHAARRAVEEASKPTARNKPRPELKPKPQAKSEPRPRPKPEPKPLEPRPVLTFAQEPDHWAIPVGALWVAAVAVAVALGTGVLMLVGVWAADDYQAGLLANRLLRARPTQPDGKAEPIDLPPDPDASWWRSTAGHLWLWALAHEGATTDPDRGESVGFFLESARKTSPVEPAVRYALAARAGDKDLERTLGLSRDVTALALRSKRLLDAGKTDLGLLFAARALDMAARTDLAALDPASFDEQVEVRRYRLPYEDVMKPILDDLAGRAGLPFLAWAKLMPPYAVCPLAAARALKEHNRPVDAADAVRIAVLAAGQAPPPRAQPAVHLAAGAEAMALAGRWADAEKQYRQAVELIPIDSIRRAWWVNLADLYLRLGDDAKARMAWNSAKTPNLRDEITLRALALQTESGIGAATTQTVSAQPAPPPPSPEPLIPTAEIGTGPEPTRVEPTANTVPPERNRPEIPLLQGPAEPPGAAADLSPPVHPHSAAPLPERPRIDVRALRAGRPPGP